MYRRLFKVFLATVLVITGFAGAVGTGSAQGDTEQSAIYFPWVPNGAMLGESGPFYGALTIQNLEDVQIGVYAIPTGLPPSEEPPILMSWLVEPFGSVTFTLEQLGVSSELEGSGVKVEAQRTSGGQPAMITGVLKQAAPEPPVDAMTGAGHATVAGYTGLSQDEIGDELILPIVQSNSGWNTIVRTTNFSLQDSTVVSIQFYEAGSGQSFGGTSATVQPGGTWTFNLLESQIGTEWVGTAIITSVQPVGAVAERVKSETNMLIMNTARPTATDGADLSTNVAPLILREWNHWNTGISIANLADQPNPITVSYYATDGTLVDSDHVTVPPLGMNFIYTPSITDPEDPENPGFVGSAIIRGDFPFHGAVDQVKYLGDDDDTGHAMSYMVETGAAGPGEMLLMPLVQKGDPETGLGDTTGIQVFNPSTESATANVWFFNESGDLAMGTPVVLELGARQGETVYTMFYPNLPAGFQGAAVIIVMSGVLTAASNNVNYAVQYDGSASFNLPAMPAEFGPYKLTLSADPNPVPHTWRTSVATIELTDFFGNRIPLTDLGLSYAISESTPGFLFVSPLTGREDGTAYIEFLLPEDNLHVRPATVNLEVFLSGTDIEAELTIIWQAPPVLQLGL